MTANTACSQNGKIHLTEVCLKLMDIVYGFSSQERLENLLLDKKFNKAFALAILLEQPFRALNILKGEGCKVKTNYELG